MTPLLRAALFALSNQETTKMPKHQIAAQRLYLTADRQALVPAGHDEAAILYANEGTIIPESACEMFGLKDGQLPGGKKASAKGAAKAAPPPPNKGAPPPPNKAAPTPPNKGAPPSPNKAAKVPEDKVIKLGEGKADAADGGTAKAPELTDIDGIGPATAKALIGAGIAGVAGLAAVDLANRPEIEGLASTFDWGSSIAAAKALVGSTDDEAAATDEEE
ncbi:hypothetical protein AAJ72_08920 [Citromicrobium sp. RCC1885]|uniref:helix-hairpin-helix domain-containing protein n=1 Tax=unclassified Citromicrobium TaxID=2630544 RepID=UPI0006C91377|nr:MULTISPECIES: helix-hairpin-helix domain-containing protein [unclassified Citromicrobium]KPM20387.1 hypothetical protein VO57_15815 [Citromicrobium sp. JL2201]KPM23035.1 hypothetical protein AAJ72_08920 [Citromicrobium sp. RCC1885]KPM27177.1 hypothetical protein AAJ74_09660 [Citromicrobium sp. RCC1878]OAM09052.1 hypothetical protein A0U43_10640 [Citromicrobium sp. RCC1897]